MKKYRHLWLKNRYVIYFFVLFYVSCQFFGSNLQNTNHLNVSAYQSGIYYIEDFATQGDGQDDFYSYIGGDEWLYCNGTGTYNQTKTNIYLVEQNSQAYMNFSFNTLNISMYHIVGTYATGGIYYTAWGTLYFRNALDQQVLKIQSSQYKNVGGSGASYGIYDGNDASIATSGVSTGNGYTQIHLYTGNNSIRIEDDILGTLWKETAPNFDYITSIKIVQLNDVYSNFFYVDNINISTTETPYLWEEITTDTEQGSVTIGNSGFTSYSTLTTSLVIENDFLVPTFIDLKRIAISVGDLTSIDDNAITLRFEDDTGISYDDQYAYSDYYILVWDIEKSFTTADLQFELSFVFDGFGGSTIEIPKYSGDLDNDNDQEYKYTHGTDYYNGIYDGYATQNYDLIYKIWYNYSYGLPTEDNYCGYDVSEYKEFGELSTQEIVSHHSLPYVEYTYDIPLDTIIKGISLHTKGMYEQDSIKSNYFAIVNSENIGNPSCWRETDIGYELFWTLNTDIENDKIKIAFYHDTKLDGYNYWKIVSSTYDLNNDGLIEHKIHNSHTKYQNLIYDGTKISGYDLGLIFYCTEPITEQEQSPYDFDLLTLSKEPYRTFETISIIWFISDISTTNFIKIHNSTGEITVQDFPKNVYTATGRTGFTPLISGWYNFTLVRNSNVKYYINITVVSNPDDYILFTYPNPSKDYQDFTLYYKYNRIDGKQGIITYSQLGHYTVEEILAGEEVLPNGFFYVDANTSGTFPMKASYDYYVFRLYSISGSIYTILKTYTHTLWDESYADSYIRASYDPLTITKGEQGRQVFTISHNFYGFDVKVKLNNKTIKDVSYSPYYYFDYYMDDTTNKQYNATLVLISENGTIVLIAYDTFNVIVVTPPPAQFDAVTSLAIGFSIPFGFILIPLFIHIKANKELNIFVYLVFIIFGLMLSTALGLLDPIIIGCIIILLSLILVIQWMYRKTA